MPQSINFDILYSTTASTPPKPDPQRLPGRAARAREHGGSAGVARRPVARGGGIPTATEGQKGGEASENRICQLFDNQRDEALYLCAVLLVPKPEARTPCEAEHNTGGRRLRMQPVKQVVERKRLHGYGNVMENDIATMADANIRRVYDEKAEKWFFSVVDVVQVLTEQTEYKLAQNYWKVLKNRLKKEGSQLVTNCNQLKLTAQDGKKYRTDVADAETILRLVQSIPSPKAEPIKLWLAKVGYERIREMEDPSIALNRSRELWREHGRSEKWIEQRMLGQETRNKLTDYWKEHGIREGQEYAFLTNLIHKEWAGLTVKEHKSVKGLKSQNLRDHMTEAELILTALAELSTRQIAESVEATGMEENTDAAKKGGGIAQQAKEALEARTGKKVVSGSNYLPPAKDK